MCEEELLALGPGSRLLDPRAGYQLLAPDNRISPFVARDDQGFSCCHHYREMIHTFPDPVKLFLKHNSQPGNCVATRWITDLTLWRNTELSPRDFRGWQARKNA